MTTLKIDLDIEDKETAIELIKDRLNFLNKINMLKYDFIISIKLIKKTNYSCKIKLDRDIKDNLQIILIQSILGDDYKHTAITYRDYLMGFESFNRMFDGKLYSNGKFKFCETIDITNEIMP